jgi:hypothetical protein
MESLEQQALQELQERKVQLEYKAFKEQRV